MPPFQDPAVARVFAGYPADVRPQVLALRRLIFEVAQRTPGVGRLDETLKWGEPAYLTAQSRSGSTLRLAWHVKNPGRYGLYFNCQTTLVATFRTLFAADFQFEGQRAIVFGKADAVPVDALSICIAAALTYHRKAVKPAG